MLHPSIEARLCDLRDQLRTARFDNDNERIVVIGHAIDRELDRANGHTNDEARMDKRRQKNAAIHSKNNGIQ
ncbi:hypothetical protein [Rhodococcus sp. SJ-2]